MLYIYGFAHGRFYCFAADIHSEFSFCWLNNTADYISCGNYRFSVAVSSYAGHKMTIRALFGIGAVGNYGIAVKKLLIYHIHYGRSINAINYACFLNSVENIIYRIGPMLFRMRVYDNRRRHLILGYFNVNNRNGALYADAASYCIISKGIFEASFSFGVLDFINNTVEKVF